MMMLWSTGSSRAIVSSLFLLLLSPQVSWAFRFPYVATGQRTGTGDSHQIDSNPDTDLASLLRSSTGSQSQVYTNAIQVLETLRVSPSCNRLAASTLIHSCQSIDGSKSDPEGSLEDVKSIYAAQLALCEITDAGSRPPGSCEPFMPSNPAQLGRKFTGSFKQLDTAVIALKGKLGFCLQALESRPQHWTSYSNNRQNAVIMCQAARIDLEKDDLIKLHKSMINTTAGANSALGQAVAAADEAVVKQKQFGQELEHFQQRLMQDLGASKANTQSYLGSLKKTLDSTLQNAIKHFSARVKDVENEAHNVEIMLRSTAAEAKELKSNIGEVFQQALEGSAELAANQATQWDAASSSTAELRDSLQSMREQEVHSLLGAFGNIHNQIQVTNELVAVMYKRQHDMDKRLVKLDKTFAGLESTAAALQTTQTADADAQMRLNDQVQVQLQIAQGLLTDITASAASLQATVHSTSSQVAHMVHYGGFTHRVLNLSWSLVILFAFYHMSPRLAGYVAATLGTTAIH
ncbi:MAG: hypothetical protein Q9166_000186 [cf. Caloplaca sp. 2 TL-2023]